MVALISIPIRENCSALKKRFAPNREYFNKFHDENEINPEDAI
jgi:hypothetical protein